MKAEIEKTGPMRLDHYISSCLYDPREGYYATRDVFGAEGDFITAPDISQIFGEMTGMWLLGEWKNAGSPDDFALVELGAGRGTWMGDILRIVEALPECADALDLYILENSPRRRREQQQNIPHKITFLDLLDLPPKPCFVISNEFFDALPIRQFYAESGGWLEAYVAYKNEVFIKDWKPMPRPIPELAEFHSEEKMIELNLGAMAIMKKIGNHIAEYGGAALSIDYGEWDGVGETLQALKSHEPTSFLEAQGEVDITAHVRFRDLAEAAKLDVAFMSQGQFLEVMGGSARSDALAKANPDLANDILDGYQRIAAADQMGQLFKALIQRKPE